MLFSILIEQRSVETGATVTETNTAAFSVEMYIYKSILKIET